jgi:membrane protease YdiL (CAAX protease family)
MIRLWHAKRGVLSLQAMGGTARQERQEPALDDVAKVPWTGWDVLGALLTTLAGSLIAIIIAAVVLTLVSEDVSASAISLVGTIALQVVILGVIWLFALRRHHCTWRDIGFRNHSLGRLLPLVALVFATGFIVNVTYSLIVAQIDRGPLKPPSTPELLQDKGLLFAAGVVLVTISAPLVEEAFFRGFVFPGLARRMGVNWAMPGSAAIFAVAHMQLVVLLPIFVLGWLLAWLYARTQTIWSCVIVHFGYNALALVLSR